MKPGFRPGLLAFAVAGLAACGDSSGPPRPAQLEGSGAPADAVVGATVNPTITVQDSRGQPLANISVGFQVSGGGGTIAVQTATTGPAGTASPGTWTLGQQPGANTLVATVAGVPAYTFTVQARADAASVIAQVPGVSLIGTVGQAVAVPPAVTVRDRFGNGIPNLPVTFTASAGVLQGAAQTTDASGTARVTSWQLGNTAGTQSWSASANGLNGTFSIDAQAGPPATMEAAAGSSQMAGAGVNVPVPPAVRLRDQFGNAARNATVTFAVTQGGGSVLGGTAIADANGIARVGAWRLGAPGTNVLTATSPGLPTITFTAQAEAMLKFSGDSTTCPATVGGCSFTVRVFNAQGPEAGRTVRWTHSSGATGTTTTNIQGFATSPSLGPVEATGVFTQTARLEPTGEERVFTYGVVQGYNIDLRFTTTVPAHIQFEFEQARLRWQQVITGNLPSVPLNIPPGACVVQHPAINETIDDLLIFAEIVPIDGVGGVLGQAGPCFVRSSSRLPVMGIMRLDIEDLQRMFEQGILRDVILHEIGHIIGLGSMWIPQEFNLVQGFGGLDPRYTGARAISPFVLGGAFASTSIPVENSGGPGSRDSHWREASLSNELMTSQIAGSGPNPLSAITIGALMDMGYQVNFGAADAYTVPLNALQAALRRGPNDVHLVELPMPPPRVWRGYYEGH